ncbi:MAG TPA: hypothetical protein VLS89_20220, partial [Candidatus Nanopelagicales bacterium]|nr:hypothetical protein [Candidatus Nanopelagicales bacterium]
MARHDEKEHGVWLESSASSPDARSAHADSCACVADHGVRLPEVSPAPADVQIPEMLDLPSDLPPPYDVPDRVVVNGLPRGARWARAERVGLGSATEIREQFLMAQGHCGICFPDSAWSNHHQIDFNDTVTACQHWLDNLQRYVKMHGNSSGTHSYAAFAGKLVTPYPLRVSTDTLVGPSNGAFETNWSASRSQTIEEGYSLGGSVGFSFSGVEVGFN